MMTEEEAEAVLRKLQASLTEFGASAVFAQARAAAREPSDRRNSKAELRLLLDEYEAVLIDAPTMLEVTMTRLEAKSITFAVDPQDTRFRPTDGVDRDLAELPASATFSSDTLSSMLNIAESTRGIIADLRRRIDE